MSLVLLYNLEQRKYWWIAASLKTLLIFAIGKGERAVDFS